MFAMFHAEVLAQKVTVGFLAVSTLLHHSHENCKTCLGLGLKLDFIAVNILVASIPCKISLLAVIVTI